MVARSNSGRLFEPGHLDAVIETLRAQAAATANPLPAWGAIFMCVSEGRELPAWAVEYVGQVAGSLWLLALRCAGDDFSSHERALEPLTPPMALDAVTQVLGFRDGTRNAFDRFVSDHAHMRDASTKDMSNVFPDKISATHALEIIAKRRGTSGKEAADRTRTVQRRISKGRKLRERIEAAKLPG